MEVRDGFIVGVFNYCDSWCETCTLTAQCRLFADMARMEASHDPNMAAVVHAPLRPQDQPPSASTWLEDVLEKIEHEPMSGAELEEFEPAMWAEHSVIHERARAYDRWVTGWLAGRERTRSGKVPTPIDVIAWFASLNHSKILRALTGLTGFDGDREFPPDHEGSAKVALIGLDRSIAAWRQLENDGTVAPTVARTCVGELEWIRRQLEAAIPLARAFVRAGFDER